MVFCFSILCCCPPTTQRRSKFLIIAGLSLPCFAVSRVTLPSPVMAYSCQRLFRHIWLPQTAKLWAGSGVFVSLAHRLLSWTKAHQTKDATRRHTWANLNPHTVCRNDKSKPTGLLWFRRATCHFTNRKGKTKKENVWKILTHFITTWTNQKEPFQTLSWLQKYFFVFL